jgi:hypothetical protein
LPPSHYKERLYLPPPFPLVVLLRWTGLCPGRPYVVTHLLLPLKAAPGALRNGRLIIGAAAAFALRFSACMPIECAVERENLSSTYCTC